VGVAVSITGVCVDRGRLLVQEPSVVRVEGHTTFVPVAEQWFKCRLFYEGANGQQDAQRAHWSSVPRPQVMTVLKDLDGVLLSFHDDYRVQIRSLQLGDAVWRLGGEPEPIRKKRKLIGYLLTVERVIERVYDDLLDQNLPDFGVTHP
jgi:hypothetical protein